MEKQKILVLEDDEKVLRLIGQCLGRAGYQMVAPTPNRQALSFPLAQICLAIMDVAIREVDIWQLCSQIRTRSDVPIILLTAKGYEVEELYSFEMGADDYIALPFSPQILAARVNALLRKKVSGPSRAGALRVDEAGRDICLDSASIELTPKEYALLLFFIHHQGAVVTRRQILERVWEDDYAGGNRTVDTHIKKIRSKLGSHRGYIQTVRGIGYKFNP